MAKKAEKMYKDSPQMERDEASGKMSVKKKTDTDGPQKASDMNQQADFNDQNGGLSPDARQTMDRYHLHAKHEIEHMVTKGDKKDLYARHAKEMADMNKRHEKELTSAPKGGLTDNDSSQEEE